MERGPQGQARDSGRSGVSPKVGRSKDKERPRNYSPLKPLADRPSVVVLPALLAVLLTVLC